MIQRMMEGLVTAEAWTPTCRMFFNGSNVLECDIHSVSHTSHNFEHSSFQTFQVLLPFKLPLVAQLK